MITLNDINLLEGETTCTTREYYQAIQRAINGGMWSLQGSYGRTMMEAITEGYCLLGETDTHDYWGNHIPSRHQVKEGTKGSFEYVIEHQGQEWANDMVRA